MSPVSGLPEFFGTTTGKLTEYRVRPNFNATGRDILKD